MPELWGQGMTALIEARNICVRVGGQEVLHDVSMQIAPREIVTILGPNGSGKSTLLRALLGILPVSHGAVSQRPGLRIGYMPQKLHIDRTMPLSASRFLSRPGRHPQAETQAMLTRVGVPEVADRPMTGLSGGQFQRVLLARALLTRPELLVLDEPTQGLDQPGIVAFYKLIEEVRAETGAAVLMVSHDLLVVMRASDRVVCLNGHVCCEGSPQAVSAAPAYRALFGAETLGTLALYQHHHDHDHDHVAPGASHEHVHGPGCAHEH